MQNRKMAEAGKHALGPIGGGKRKKSLSFGKKKFFVGWKNKMLVGKKTCRLKKKVGWRISPAKSGNVRTFPGMQDRKTAEAGKNALGPIGGKRKIFFCHLEKKVFYRLEKQNVGWKKNLSFEKKCRLENFPCQKRTCPECPEFPVMQDRKTAEAGKHTLGPIGGKKGKNVCPLEEKSFLLVGKTKCWLEKKLVG